MDSLSHVLKQVIDPAKLRQAQAKSKEIMADPLIVKWRKRYPEIDEAEMKRNANQFYQYVTEYKNCSQCPGLERCPNDMEGHYTMVTAEVILGTPRIYDKKVSCKKFIAKQTQDAIRSRIHSFYVDERSMELASTADEILQIDMERVKAVRSIMRYIDTTKEKGLQRNGLYLQGKFGTGKTFLMCYMLHQLAKEGLSGVIVYMPDFSEDLKAMFSDPQKLKGTIDLLKETDLLIFDDIGAENMNPWLRDHALGTILNYRMNRKPTFFTSNYSLDHLEQHFSFTSKDGEEVYKGQRIMDRIRPFVELVQVEGHNKRGAQGL